MSTTSTTNPFPLDQTKKKAKHLKSMLKVYLPEISHGECLNIISRLHGAKDWNTYRARLTQGGASNNQVNEIDNFIKNTALPLIASAAAKHRIKVETDQSKIENFEFKKSDKQFDRRKLLVKIEPTSSIGVTFCESFLDVSMTKVRFSSGFLSCHLNFIFPKEAFPAVMKIFSSNKLGNGIDPQLTRVETGQDDSYMLTVNICGVSDTVDHGFTIQTDPKIQSILKRWFNEFFSNYRRVINSYNALLGKWNNKKLLINFENSVWKLNCSEPPYMASSNRFYSSTIAGITLHGALGSFGPLIIGPDGSVEIGVCSIIYIADVDKEQSEGYYISKYGDSWQTAIHLKGFSDADISKVTAEFGIPRGHFSEYDTSFYQTPAFKALCNWVEENPRYAKRVGRKDGRYLPDWYDQVLARKPTEFSPPTTTDFLNAIEKAPYLIAEGIRCSYHIDTKKTAEENKATFFAQRESFAGFGFKEFSVCCKWLQGCHKRKTLNSSINSYRLKHMVEAWTVRTKGEKEYVSNGAFIAAAIHMGFDWKPNFDSPNVKFNISGKSPAILDLKGVSII